MIDLDLTDERLAIQCMVRAQGVESSVAWNILEGELVQQGRP